MILLGSLIQKRSFPISENLDTVIGIDLGGSNVRAVLADTNGGFLAELSAETADGSADAVVAQLAMLCRRLTDGERIEPGAVDAVAVGVPGVVRGGQIEMAPNLPRFDDLDLASALAAELGVSVVVENDVNMATEGEHRRGHGVGVDDFVFVAVGTGIGMGIVTGGRLRRGATGAAGEIGALPMGAATLEDLAGGAGIAVRFTQGAGSAVAASAQDVFAAAETGDAVAGRVLAEQADAIARGLTAVQSVLDPELVVFGGGIGSRPDVISRVEGRLAAATRRLPLLRASALGERAGVVGAVEVACEYALRPCLEQLGA